VVHIHPVDVEKVEGQQLGDALLLANINIFFSEPYQNARTALESDQPILVKGKKDGKADGDKVLAESVELLSDLRARGTQEVHLRLDWKEVNAKTIAALENLLQASPGTCATRVCLVDPGRKEVILKLGKRFCVAPDEDLTDGMAMIFRRNDVVSFL